MHFPPLEHRDWLDEVVQEHQQKGGFDDLKGKGKPLSKETLTGDVFQSILKNNQYIPPWLELRHQIREQIHALYRQIQQKSAPDATDRKQVMAINNQIKKYNRQCPHASMQRGLIDVDRLEEALPQWE